MNDQLFPQNNWAMALLTVASYQLVLEKTQELAQKTRKDFLVLTVDTTSIWPHEVLTDSSLPDLHQSQINHDKQTDG